MVVKKHYFNNIQINDPNNHSELKININFDTGDPEAQQGVSLNEWELGVGTRGDAADGLTLANEWKNGPYGVLQMPPFRVDIIKGTEINTVFEGFLDLSKSLFEDDKVTALAVEKGGVDWFNDVAARVDFAQLAADIIDGGEGLITEADYVLVPYVVDSLKVIEYLVVLGQTVLIGTQLANQIALLVDYIASLSGVFTFGMLAAIITRVAFILTLLVSFALYIKDLINMSAQPIKYHAAMYVRTLFERACQVLGYEFKSSILQSDPWNKLAILPKKGALPVNTSLKGVLGNLTKTKTDQKGYYKQRFNSLVEAMIIMFNGKPIIQNEGTVFRFERRDYNASTPKFVLPNVKLTELEFNRENLVGQTNVRFLTDLSDKFTIQEYEGTEAQVQLKPINITTPQQNSIDGFKDYVIPFALGKRKTELNQMEEIINAFAKAYDFLLGQLVKVVNAAIRVINAIIKVINKIIKALNKIPKINIKIRLKPLRPIQVKSLSALLEDRLGILKMESDFIEVPKLIMVPNNLDPRANKLDPRMESLLNSEHLYDSFRSIDTFDPANAQGHNQNNKFEVSNVPVLYEDYLNLRADNKLLLQDGRIGDIKGLEWDPEEFLANITFWINEVVTPNIRTVKIIPNGK